MNNWYDFYLNRVNSTYQQYFEQRYAPMINIIKDINPITLLEEGIGIGSLSKSLEKDLCYCRGYDLCPRMVELAKLNLSGHKVDVFQWNILNKLISSIDLYVSHGVLEHFSHTQLLFIKSKYDVGNQHYVHYVPTDGYDTPSFGDERLLPYTYWLNLFKPKDYLLFNEDKDLLIIN